MLDFELLFFFRLWGDWIMTDQERLLSTVRQDTYKLYEDKTEELRYLRQKIERL